MDKNLIFMAIGFCSGAFIMRKAFGSFEPKNNVKLEDVENQVAFSTRDNSYNSYLSNSPQTHTWSSNSNLSSNSGVNSNTFTHTNSPYASLLSNKGENQQNKKI
jgi:hypothetical protein